MDARARRTAATVAAVAAVVFILSMFLDWYTLDLPAKVGGREIEVPTYNAFQGLERADVALVAAAMLALLVSVALWSGFWAESPLPALALLTAGGFLALLVIYRGTSRPSFPFFGGGPVDTVVAFGWFVALTAAAAIALCGVWAYLTGPRLQFEGRAGDWENDEGD